MGKILFPHDMWPYNLAEDLLNWDKYKHKRIKRDEQALVNAPSDLSQTLSDTMSMYLSWQEEDSLYLKYNSGKPNDAIETLLKIDDAGKAINNGMDTLLDRIDLAALLCGSETASVIGNLTLMHDREICYRFPCTMPVGVLGLTTQAYRMLRQNGIYTLGDLIALDDHELAQFHNCGQKTIQEIVSHLGLLGYTLKGC